MLFDMLVLLNNTDMNICNITRVLNYDIYNVYDIFSPDLQFSHAVCHRKATKGGIVENPSYWFPFGGVKNVKKYID